MRAPDGTLISQFELHDLEKLSLIKIDLLSIESADRIQTCLELLLEQNYIEKKETLRETYENVLGVYKIKRDEPEMWNMVKQHKILSLFQMEQESGIRGIALTEPNSVDDLATLNSVIRLMAQEKGAETPLEKYTRFRKNKGEFEREMIEYGLTKEERNILHKQLDISSGLCITQEQFMELVQLPECGGWDLQFADRLRKSIAKKNPKEYEVIENQFFDRVDEKKLHKEFCDYVWNKQIALSRGYGFNASHTLVYSIIGLQEMNLAYNYPIIFWNTANLIVDSAGIQEVDEDGDIKIEPEQDAEPEEELVSIYEPEEWEEYEYEDLPDRSAKKKKKIKTVDYGRIATAIGKFKTYGINVNPPDINTSTFTFTPVVETNTILYGLRGIARISVDLVNDIIANRPYSSMNNFVSKVKTNKIQMTNLIKCGAFDALEHKDRTEIMRDYLEMISDKKEKLTLQNMPSLIERRLIPEEMKFYAQLFSFNKFLKKNKNGEYYNLNDAAIEFISKHFDLDDTYDGDKISQKVWDKIYSKSMEPMRVYLKEHKDEMLNALNYSYYKENEDKYAEGNISKWEMSSLSFYSHPHELDYCNVRFTDFFKLPDEPKVARTFPAKDGGIIKIYELNTFGGVVIDKNKTKNTITLLTQTGVVTVKIYKNQFALYDKQLSVVGENGKKKVIEKSWFQRGTLLMVQGIRRGSNLIPKKYKDSVYPVISKITKIKDDGGIVLQYERQEV